MQMGGHILDEHVPVVKLFSVFCRGSNILFMRLFFKISRQSIVLLSPLFLTNHFSDHCGFGVTNNFVNMSTGLLRIQIFIGSQGQDDTSCHCEHWAYEGRPFGTAES